MPYERTERQELTREILATFYSVYNGLGYGFLESHYALALERRLRAAGRRVAREYAVRIFFDGEELGFHRLDLVVDETIVVEIKATPALAPSARSQILNYLRATNLEIGLLLHFGPTPKFLRFYNPKRHDSKDEQGPVARP